MKRLALVVAGLLLAGCTAVSSGTPTTPSGVPGTAAASGDATASGPTDLLAMRRAAGIADCPTATASAATGGLPDVTLGCLGGGTTVRLAGLRGPMLVNLWAQWCYPCRAESAHLAAFASTSKTVKVLGIDFADPQPELAIQFAQLTAMTYPHVTDPDGATRIGLGISGIPASFLIDAKGAIVARHVGAFGSLESVQEWVRDGLGS
jgi:thiol-disulfide isomerase/thioredoxin